MSKLVLIDSSAWVEATRRGGNAETAAYLQGLLSEGRVAMTEPIWVELFQGIRGRREEEDLTAVRSLSVSLPFDETCWELAARNGHLCLRAGVNVPFGDLLVDACARRYEIELVERDRHFAMIAGAVEG
ncbi:MAG: PIN domain-containing protein [Chthoniobacterales bacterium]